MAQTNPLQQPILAAPSEPPPARLWIGLTLAVLLDTPVQLIWKALMLKYASPHRGPKSGIDLTDLLHQSRWFLHQTRSWGLLALFLAQFFNWMWVLGNADLSFAQPFTALSYVLVSSAAAFFFHEHIGPLRMLGIALILAGVLLVGSSPHRTTRQGHAHLPLEPAEETA